MNRDHAFELKFSDGKTAIVHEFNFSRACVRAQWERFQEGAATHKEFNVESGRRRPDLDKAWK